MNSNPIPPLLPPQRVMRKIAFLFIFHALMFGCFADGERSECSGREELALLYGQARYQEAISLCRDNFLAGKEEAFYLLNLALLYEETGQIDKAVTILKDGYGRYNDQEILFHLGRLLCLSGEGKEAVSVLTKYLRSDAKDKRAYFYLGLASEESGELKEAGDFYRRSLSIDEHCKTCHSASIFK